MAHDQTPNQGNANQPSTTRGSQTTSRGFAAMDQDRQREIASKGGQASGGNFKHNPSRAAEAGQKGGQMSGGNFKNNPDRAAQAGQKGGMARSQAAANQAANQGNQPQRTQNGNAQNKSAGNQQDQGRNPVQQAQQPQQTQGGNPNTNQSARSLDQQDKDRSIQTQKDASDKDRKNDETGITD